MSKAQEEIIDSLCKLILELLKIGHEKFQEANNLFCEAEKVRDEYKEEARKIFPLPSNVINIEDHRKGGKKICSRCKIRERQVFKSGRLGTYCKECNAQRVKDNKTKKEMLQ